MTLTKFLDPKNDVAFKKIFGTEKNKDILIQFLNDVIDFKGKQPIKNVTFLKNELDPETQAHKVSLVDIMCEDQSGNRYIVEMQVCRQKGFEKRAQYYAAKAYTSQAKKNGEYHDLKEVIFLAVADFDMFPKKKGYKSDHVILDKETLENDLKDFSFTFLELRKMKKKIDQLSNRLEKWVYFFLHAEDTKEKDLAKIVGSDEIIERAYEELDRFSWDDKDLMKYENAEKREADHQAILSQKLDEGIAIGRAEGLVEGEAKGHAKGLVEGEEKGKIDIIRRLLAKYPPEFVAEMTGLTLQQIEQFLVPE